MLADARQGWPIGPPGSTDITIDEPLYNLSPGIFPLSQHIISTEEVL